jgi:hypothetical protein
MRRLPIVPFLLTIGLAATLSLASACDDDPSGPDTGTIDVTVATTGEDIDPDGYTVSLDGGGAQAVTVNGSVDFTSVEAGQHVVLLAGVAANCTVAGDNPRTVTVTEGGTTTVAFSVTCVADFEASLTGAAERPDPVTTDATGAAFFDVEGTTVSFRVDVEDIQNVTLAHIHVGATDVAGPIVVELFNASGNPVSFTTRGVLAEATFTEADIDADSGITTLDALLAAMAAGTTYVNVHTTANPGGEIRGQIVEN